MALRRCWRFTGVVPRLLWTSTALPGLLFRGYEAQCPGLSTLILVAKLQSGYCVAGSAQRHRAQM
ncbi:hypothetical protein INR49_026688 [Caranx melampygus]|nr:hypothetical protein INR49_026688 [Caranx melampygus]